MDLREYLFRKRISITDFSTSINFSRNYVSQIVNGGIKPGKKIAKIIEMATDGEVTVEELMNLKKDIDN